MELFIIVSIDVSLLEDLIARGFHGIARLLPDSPFN